MASYRLLLDEPTHNAHAAPGISTPAHEPHGHVHSDGTLVHWGNAHIFVASKADEDGKYVVESNVPIEYDADRNAIVVLDFDAG